MPIKTRRWAIEMDWAAINQIDDTNVSFCLTRRQATALLGLTEYLAWQTRWTNLGATTLADLNDFKEEIQSRLLDMDCLRFRQDPTDPCMLQISYDSGSTWSDAFDYGSCLPAGLIDIINQNAQDIIDALNTLYDGTPESIAPDLEYGDGDDSIRDDLICVAIHLIVQTMVDAEIERRARDSSGWVSFANLLEASAVLLFGAATGGIALAAAIAAGFLTIAADVWIDLSEAVLNDDDAQDKVACCMYNAVRGNDLTFTAFSTSLDDCGFTFGSYEAQLAGAIAPLLNDLDVYLTFLKLLQDYWDLAKAGFLDSACPCADTFCHTEDWTTGPLAWAGISPDPTNEAAGVHVPATGWQHEDIVVTTNEHRRSINIEKSFATAFTLTKLSMVLNMTRHSSLPNGFTETVFLVDDGVGTTNVLAYSKPNAPVGTDVTHAWEDIGGELCERIQLFYRVSYDTTSPYTYGGDILLKNLIICGDGDKPPELV